jgi:cytochrome c biogenesis protein CcmG/thiol:disulfide interchange protein DsbE
MLLTAGVGVVLAALVVLFIVADPKTSEISNPLIGKAAPEVVGTDTSGRPFSVSAYRGQWLLVNFFAHWCVPCQTEQPELIAFSERHRDGTASVASISFQDSEEDARKFFADNGGDWAVVIDDKKEFAVEYGVVKIPESYLVNPEGVIVTKFVGGVTADGIDAEIRKNTP